jgi:hypothetical protein
MVRSGTLLLPVSLLSRLALVGISCLWFPRGCTQHHQFIIDSLPNAEFPTVEPSSHELEVIRNPLHHRATTTQGVCQTLLDVVNNLLLPLQDFIPNPPPLPATILPTECYEVVNL